MNQEYEAVFQVELDDKLEFAGDGDTITLVGGGSFVAKYSGPAKLVATENTTLHVYGRGTDVLAKGHAELHLHGAPVAVVQEDAIAFAHGGLVVCEGRNMRQQDGGPYSVELFGRATAQIVSGSVRAHDASAVVTAWGNPPGPDVEVRLLDYASCRACGPIQLTVEDRAFVDIVHRPGVEDPKLTVVGEMARMRESHGEPWRGAALLDEAQLASGVSRDEDGAVAQSSLEPGVGSSGPDL